MEQLLDLKNLIHRKHHDTLIHVWMLYFLSEKTVLGFGCFPKRKMLRLAEFSFRSIQRGYLLHYFTVSFTTQCLKLGLKNSIFIISYQYLCYVMSHLQENVPVEHIGSLKNPPVIMNMDAKPQHPNLWQNLESLLCSYFSVYSRC